MRLSDIMSHMDLTVYPEIALVIFLGVFGAVVLRLCRAGGSRLQDHAGMALDECPIVNAARTTDRARGSLHP